MQVSHRAGRRFNFQGNRIRDTEPIREATVLQVDPLTGHIVREWGKNLAWLPHGLKVANGYLWLVDVGRHQVQRFPLDRLQDDAVPGQTTERAAPHSHGWRRAGWLAAVDSHQPW
eukprot:scaffold1146_cov399-Prasinococcus_capsulatus_cf.AAC.6